ncbi:MAG: hypothetical protein AAB676_08340 [Verrucomicrobiota bacterium]
MQQQYFLVLIETVEQRRNPVRQGHVGSEAIFTIESKLTLVCMVKNSPQMIFKHYRELVRPAEAKTWFALTPGGEEKVIEAPKAEAGNQNSEDRVQMSALA